MKFNLEVTIDEVNEQCTHGVIHYDEVLLSCYRSTGDTFITQGGYNILLSLKQAEELYKHLHTIFGETNEN